MHAARLSALRAELRRLGVDGFLVPRADEHLGEYVAPRAERLTWLTGFTGSAGVAVVTQTRAAVFSDGRYVLQLAEQTDPAVWERRHMVEEPPATWLSGERGLRIGYDPWLISEEGLRQYTDAAVAMVPLSPNPLDTVWTDQPPPPAVPAVVHGRALSGRNASDKQAEVAQALRVAGQAAAVISDPASVAWLFNIRGGDVPYTPVALGFALVHDDASCELFMAAEKLSPELRVWLGNAVSVAEYSAIPAALQRLAGRRVRVDDRASPAWFAQSLRSVGAEPVAGLDPCLLPKASKNAVEQQGARDAHRHDAVAVIRFLRWLETATGETEMSAADRLLAERAQRPGFRGESFPAISGAGEHGAVIHYRVTPETNRAINPGELYLIDSGAQYECGTTDITRTVWTGPDAAPAPMRDHVTRVLRGHVAMSMLVFPKGVCGAHLDSFARQALWQAGLDYDHGTGHGVGSYLSVHEGPVSLSRAARPIPLAAGMILSNEPGFYLPGAYGIRIENLLLVQEAALPQATKPFLGFETLTLAPYDRRLIDIAQLSAAEIAWIDAYHARVLAEIGPILDADTCAWLHGACRPL